MIDPNSMLIDIDTAMKIGISKDVVGRQVRVEEILEAQ